eukprot:7091799-Prymnesium_polylepis.1
MLNDAGGPCWSYESRAGLETFVWGKQILSSQQSPGVPWVSAHLIEPFGSTLTQTVNRSPTHVSLGVCDLAGARQLLGGSRVAAGTRGTCRPHRRTGPPSTRGRRADTRTSVATQART